MTNIHKRRRFSHKGIIGVESAIVLIAFVIVAAALAFVVMNMGFSTTQEAKTTIVSTLGTSSSSLQISAGIKGAGHSFDDALNVTAIPIKIVPGGNPINLAEKITSVTYQSNTIFYDDIYAGTLNPGVRNSLEDATGDALIFGYIDNDPYTDNDYPTNTVAFLYWSINSNDNDILESGEHAVLAIVFAKDERPKSLDKIIIEIIGKDGATLTIERKVPNITNEVVDMG